MFQTGESNMPRSNTQFSRPQVSEQQYQQAVNFCGYLEKKSPSIFTGYQKRWFFIIDGKLLAYSESKDKISATTKGAITIKEATFKIIDKLNFNVTFEDRVFELRATSQNDVQNWINVLTLLKNYNPSKSPYGGDEDNVEQRNKAATIIKGQGHKLQNLNKESLEVLKNSGNAPVNEDSELSKKMLAVKGIEKHFRNVPKPFLESRWAYGFLGKRHKSSMEIYQKRWFFLISSRPLTDRGYENDDQILEDKVLPSFLSFDIIYYYNVENESDNSGPNGDIPLFECHGVEVKDINGKFNLLIDMGDRKYELQSEIKGERDLWFEYVKNSRKTAKDVKTSLTKRPRNINKLCNILAVNGEEKLRKYCEDEVEKIVSNYKDIKDFDTLSFVIENIQKPLLQTLDGLCLVNPPKVEIIKIYVDTFDSQILTLIQNYWKSVNEHMTTTQMIELSNLLFTYDDKLSQFGITDQNFGINGRELVKIFAKKTYLTMRQLVENILKSERETKAIKDSEGILITNGPTDITNLISKSLNLIKNEKRKAVFEQFLKISKETIMQYLSGNDYLIGRNDLDIDKEFLVAIINNVMTLNLHISSLKDEVANFNVLVEKEIETNIEEKAIYNAVNLVTSSTLSRFVLEMIVPVAKSFGDNFLGINMENIMNVVVETFGKYLEAMNFNGKKKLWTEILKGVVFLYIKSLLTTAHRKVKKMNELTDKLKNDINFLLNTFEEFIGKNTTEINLKILNDFLEFLDCSVSFIGMSCSKLREFNGPAFNLTTVRALIHLRVDFSSDEKKEAIESCKDMLDHFDKANKSNKKGAGNSMLDMLSSEIAKDEQAKNNDNFEVPEEEASGRRKTINLADFLIDEDEDQEKGEEEPEEEAPQIFKSKTINTTQDTDVIKCGMMKKKTHSSWQERFFQLKNGKLYWYINETAREAQNCIDLKEMKRVFEHKEGKFLLEGLDKVYKFESPPEETKKWIEAINGEMKKIKSGVASKRLENVYEAKVKPKIITTENFELPDFNKDKFYMRRKVESDLKTEKFFPLKPKPIVAKKETKQASQVNTETALKLDETTVSAAAEEDSGTDMKAALLVINPDEQAPMTCSEKCSACWLSFKEKLGLA